MRSLQPATTLALLVALLVLAGMGTVFVSTATPDEQAPVRVPNQLVEPKSGNNVIWAYTSRDRTATERTLPINVIVHGDADDVRYYLTERIGATWNETDEEWEEINPDESAETGVDDRNATVIEWASARGATRYMYVHDLVLTEERTESTTRRPHRAHPYVPEEPYEASGQWIESTYQLHDGDYFGTRHHLRVYESPYETDEWVAIQAHQEHWDWFQLRHTVDGIEDAQSNVESEFMGRPYVDDVWRMHLENDRGADADGWATVIELESLPARDVTRVGPAAVALVFVHSLGRVTPFRGRNVRGRLRPDVEHREEGAGASPSRNVDLLARIDHRHLLLALRALSHGALFGALLALYLAVRAGGILLENTIRRSRRGSSCGRCTRLSCSVCPSAHTSSPEPSIPAGVSCSPRRDWGRRSSPTTCTYTSRCYRSTWFSIGWASSSPSASSPPVRRTGGAVSRP